MCAAALIWGLRRRCSIFLDRLLSSKQVAVAGKKMPSSSVLQARGPPVNYVVSLGSHCHTSYALRQACLKRFSCPFDWIFSQCDMLIDCLDTRFEKLLDKREFIDHSQGKSLKTVEEKIRAGHKTYGPMLFNHHDPRRPDHYEYYKRCVERFRVVATDAAAHKLYVHLQINNNTLSTSDAKKLNAALKRHGCKNYTLLVINHKVAEKGQQRRYDVSRKANNLLMIDLISNTASNGVAFESKKDNDFLDGMLKKLFNYELSDYEMRSDANGRGIAKPLINKGVRASDTKLYKAIRLDYKD